MGGHGMGGHDMAIQHTRGAWYKPEVEELGDVAKVTLFDDTDHADLGSNPRDADDS